MERERAEIQGDDSHTSAYLSTLFDHADGQFRQFDEIKSPVFVGGEARGPPEVANIDATTRTPSERLCAVVGCIVHAANRFAAAVRNSSG